MLVSKGLSLCSSRTRFGNQGAAQAQNLRDSGIPNEKIIIANRPDHYAEDAKSRGFNVDHDFANAAKTADGTFIIHATAGGADVHVILAFQSSSCSSPTRSSRVFLTTRSRPI